MSTDREGWTLLGDVEYDWLWNTFSTAFQFRLSGAGDSWAGIYEPTPSVTFDLTTLTVHQTEVKSAVNGAVLGAITEGFPEVEEWYALEVNSDAYRFHPAVEASNASALVDDGGRDLPAPYPNGEYFVWLTPDLSNGTFAHPWQQTLCVFGERLAPAASPALSRLMSPVRRDGHAITSTAE